MWSSCAYPARMRVNDSNPASFGPTHATRPPKRSFFTLPFPRKRSRPHHEPRPGRAPSPLSPHEKRAVFLYPVRAHFRLGAHCIFARGGPNQGTALVWYLCTTRRRSTSRSEHRAAHSSNPLGWRWRRQSILARGRAALVPAGFRLGTRGLIGPYVAFEELVLFVSGSGPRQVRSQARPTASVACGGMVRLSLNRHVFMSLPAGAVLPFHVTRSPLPMNARLTGCPPSASMARSASECRFHD